jgi:hypothetical protein
VEIRNEERVMAVSSFAIMAIQPTQGPVGTDVTIDLFGVPDSFENFEVFIGQWPMTYVMAGRNSLRATVPQGATTATIRVDVVGGDRNDSSAHSAQQFTVTQGDVSRIRITTINPVTTRPGGSVILTGSGFDHVVQIVLGPSIQVLGFGTQAGGTRIRFQVPATTPPGSYTVNLRTRDLGPFRSLMQLTVQAAGGSN